MKSQDLVMNKVWGGEGGEEAEVCLRGRPPSLPLAREAAAFFSLLEEARRFMWARSWSGGSLSI